MRDSLVELAISALIALVFLLVAVWEVATGRIVYLDGIALTLISLTLAVFFAFNIFWSMRTGELRTLLRASRHEKGERQEGDKQQREG